MTTLYLSRATRALTKLRSPLEQQKPRVKGMRSLSSSPLFSTAAQDVVLRDDDSGARGRERPGYEVVAIANFKALQTVGDQQGCGYVVECDIQVGRNKVELGAIYIILRSSLPIRDLRSGLSSCFSASWVSTIEGRIYHC